jgi:hypothetical protein
MKPDISTALPQLEAAYNRGKRDGYAIGLRDGQLTPEALKAKHESMKTWVPKRRSDRPDWGVPA